MGSTPLADNGPLVGASQLWTQGAGGRDVFGESLRDLRLREDLVLVGVEDNVGAAGLPVHEAVPVSIDVLESVVDSHCSVAVTITDNAIAVKVKGLKLVHINRTIEGFVE